MRKRRTKVNVFAVASFAVIFISAGVLYFLKPRIKKLISNQKLKKIHKKHEKIHEVDRKHQCC